MFIPPAPWQTSIVRRFRFPCWKYCAWRADPPHPIVLNRFLSAVGYLYVLVRDVNSMRIVFVFCFFSIRTFLMRADWCDDRGDLDRVSNHRLTISVHTPTHIFIIRQLCNVCVTRNARRTIIWRRSEDCERRARKSEIGPINERYGAERTGFRIIRIVLPPTPAYT